MKTTSHSFHVIFRSPICVPLSPKSEDLQGRKHMDIQTDSHRGRTEHQDSTRFD